MTAEGWDIQSRREGLQGATWQSPTVDECESFRVRQQPVCAATLCRWCNTSERDRVVQEIAERKDKVKAGRGREEAAELRVAELTLSNPLRLSTV